MVRLLAGEASRHYLIQARPGHQRQFEARTCFLNLLLSEDKQRSRPTRGVIEQSVVVRARAGDPDSGSVPVLDRRSSNSRRSPAPEGHLGAIEGLASTRARDPRFGGYVNRDKVSANATTCASKRQPGTQSTPTTGACGLPWTPTALLRGEPISHRWSANYLTSRTPYGRLAPHEDLADPESTWPVRTAKHRVHVRISDTLSGSRTS